MAGDLLLSGGKHVLSLVRSSRSPRTTAFLVSPEDDYYFYISVRHSEPGAYYARLLNVLSKCRMQPVYDGE